MANSRYARFQIFCLTAVLLSVTPQCYAQDAPAAPPVDAVKPLNIIRVAADPWCPYNCEPGYAQQGLMIDIARAALKRSGYVLNYQIINWARAKQLVVKGELDGIVGMSREGKTETLYHFSKTPLGWSQTCFFKRTDDPWAYQSTQSLEGKVMGWINDYGFTNLEIDQWVKARKGTPEIATVSGEKVHHSLFQMLLAKRIDTFAEDLYVVQHKLRKDNLAEAISVAGCAPEKDEVHIAFSLKSPHKDAWASALDEGVKQLRESGELARILGHYNLSLEQWSR